MTLTWTPAGQPRRVRRYGFGRVAGISILVMIGGFVAACSSRPAASVTAIPAAHTTATDQLSIIGKIDADSGAPGTFTGIDGWPAVAPSDFHIHAGAKVVLTIKEYDDMVTPIPESSPFHDVIGGTELVDGKPVTSVDNDHLAHTITVPQLHINIPLPIAPEHGYTTVQFTFVAPDKPGTYLWECVTPCGDGPMGIMGAMQTTGWMRGHVVVT